ncbi:MAG: hypothetical protein ACLQGT_00700 [Terracidiphilus sp.]
MFSFVAGAAVVLSLLRILSSGVFDSGGYSKIRVSVPKAGEFKWIFPQEKAAFRNFGEGMLTLILLKNRPAGNSTKLMIVTLQIAEDEIYTRFAPFFTEALAYTVCLSR